MSLIELPADSGGLQTSKTNGSTAVADAVADPLPPPVSMQPTVAATSSPPTASVLGSIAADAATSLHPLSATQSDSSSSAAVSSLLAAAPAAASPAQSSSASSALASLSELLNALPASPPLPPAAATSSSSPAVFASTLSLSAADDSWQLSLSSLTEELNAMDEETQREAMALLQSRMQRNAQLIAADDSGIGALPHSDAASRGWYAVVMDAYLKLRRGSRRTEAEGRREFMRRKVKAREARKQRKAEDAFDRQQHRMQRGRQKASSRRRAAY